VLTHSQSAAFSPDGKEIVTVNPDQSAAEVWSTTSYHRKLGVLTEPSHNMIGSASFSPHGKDIVTTSGGTAQIWSASSLQQLMVITAPDGSFIESAAFRPDGKEIVTTSDDGTARIWSTELAGPVPVLERIAEMRVTRQLTPSERKMYLPQG
jgi:WD40 repeat protein